MAVPRSRARSWWPRALALVALAASLTCGGDDGGGADDHTTIAGTAYWGGPVRGATVVAFQLVDGQRTLEVARTTSGTDGVFLLEAGRTYEHVEIDVIGGTYTEPTGGDVALDASTVLQGVVLDLALGEARTGVTISPWTHLTVALGRARLGIPREDTYGLAVGKVIARLKNHLGFDPTTTPVAPTSAPGNANQGPTLHGLTLAGLSQLAALAAADQGASIQSINTVALTKVLARDAASAEALFDGNQAELLYVGATCPLPSGCSAEGPGCYASCSVHTNTLRARLGAAVRAFLLTLANRTTLDKDDLGPWLEGIRTRVDADLFGTEEVEEFDTLGPTITWQAPAADATVAGTVAVEVTATDALGVMSLTVTAQTATPMPLTDTDPAPERFAATFSTVGLPEGALVLLASAADVDGNLTDAPRMVVLNNVVGGTVSGVVFKGRVGGAAVRVFRFENGVRGAMMGSGTTQADGSFTNVTIADGYTGPLLVEAGFGGTYGEEADSATVTLDVADRLRTVVPAYADGGAISSLVVSPLTSFATTYLEYLRTSNQGGTTVPARWTTARGAMEAHFGVANIYDLLPLAPSEMTTFNAQARYGMVLVGLSELARTASTLGGGDGGTFGTSMTSIRVFNVLDTDLADGCWDGHQGATQLHFGGTRAVTTQSTRLDLANAIVAYLTDGNGARNQTPYAGAADVLTQLDALGSGGGNNAVGSCSATGRLNPDDGGPFDQTRPTVTFLEMPAGATPPAGHVRGVITVDALADDDLDDRPTLRFTSPMNTLDGDGDETDPDSHHLFDTTQRPDGPLVVTLEAKDDAGNVSDPVLSTRTFIVDNTGPVINIGGVTDGAWYATGPFVTFAVTETNLASLTATLDGLPFSSGGQVSAIGMHTLVVTAQDQAGAMAMRTVTFYVDPTAPTWEATVSSPAGNYVRGSLAVTATATDNLAAAGSLGPNIVVTATRNGAPVTPALSYPAVSGGRRQVVATFNTPAIGDGVLTVRFNVVDRAGNAAAEQVWSTTIDNTAPTGVTITGIDTTGGLHEYFEASATPPTRWVDTATPTLIGSYSEANPGATVSVSVGAMGVTGTTTSASAWRGAVPTGSVSTGGSDATVTITDAAGNVGSATQRLRYDGTPPVVDSPTITTVRDESADIVTRPGGTTGPWNHNHAGNPIELGGSVVSCPTVVKYAYLTAATPEAGQSAPNPITFSWIASESGGVGVNVATLRYLVRTPGGATRGPFTVAAPGGSPGAYTFTTTLYRDALPELGVPGQTEEGAFHIDVYATDRLGNDSLVASRCWTHRPRGVPLFLAQAPQTLPAVVYGNSLFNLSLAANSSASTLLNGTNPGAGFMQYALENITSDAVWMNFTPSVASMTYSKNWSYYRTPVATAAASITCSYDSETGEYSGTDVRCSGYATGLIASEMATNATFSPVPATDLSTRIWRENSSISFEEVVPCGACSGRHELAGNKKFWVVVGVQKLAALRQTVPPVAAGYEEAVRNSLSPTTPGLLISVNRTSTPPQAFSSSGPGINETCTRWVQVTGSVYRCTQVTTLQAVKYLVSASVTANSSTAIGTSHAGASLSPASQHANAVTLISLLNTNAWTTTEN